MLLGMVKFLYTGPSSKFRLFRIAWMESCQLGVGPSTKDIYHQKHSMLLSVKNYFQIKSKFYFENSEGWLYNFQN